MGSRSLDRDQSPPLEADAAIAAYSQPYPTPYARSEDLLTRLRVTRRRLALGLRLDT